MYHEQNKHTRFSPLTAYFVNNSSCIRFAKSSSFLTVTGGGLGFLPGGTSLGVRVCPSLKERHRYPSVSLTPRLREPGLFSHFRHPGVKRQHLFSQSQTLSKTRRTISEPHPILSDRRESACLSSAWTSLHTGQNELQ